MGLGGLGAQGRGALARGTRPGRHAACCHGARLSVLSPNMSGPGLQGKMCQPPQKNFPAMGWRGGGKGEWKAVSTAGDEPETTLGPASTQNRDRPCSGPATACRRPGKGLPVRTNLHLQTDAAAATSYPRRRQPPRPPANALLSGPDPYRTRPAKGRAFAPAQTCGRGETGSHSGLKIRRPQTAYGFESRRPHQAASAPITSKSSPSTPPRSVCLPGGPLTGADCISAPNAPETYNAHQIYPCRKTNRNTPPGKPSGV